MDLKDLFKRIKEFEEKEVIVQGWIRNHRDQKTFGFIDFSDGTCQEHLQIVYDETLSTEKIADCLVSHGVGLSSLFCKRESLEDYFTSLTGGVKFE